jgi:glycosyltransferase involved in cell wall biosynthesis
VRVIATGKVGPALKRDLALRYSDAEVLAFLDDDAYPEPDWLDRALPHFEDPSVGAVGGPAVTPGHDNVWQKASGEVYSTWLGGGVYSYRYVPQGMRKVDDFPSVNLLIRRDVFEMLGGFDSSFWPGEDTKLCLDLTHKLGLSILYDPSVLVWHHRRELFFPHCRQVANYAKYRGFFAKAYPETSRRPSFFLPSAFAITCVAALGGIIGDVAFLKPAVLAVILYSVLLAASVLSVSWRHRNPVIGLLAGAGIFSTHLCYGVFFLKGLLGARLDRQPQLSRQQESRDLVGESAFRDP